MRLKERLTIAKMIHILRKEVYGTRKLRGTISLCEKAETKLAFRKKCLFMAMRILSIRREYVLSRYIKDGDVVHYNFCMHLQTIKLPKALYPNILVGEYFETDKGVLKCIHYEEEDGFLICDIVA